MVRSSTNDETFFFYDLETTGVNPKTDRIMQFAGQRTDAQLNPIGKPYNLLIKLSDDVLPDPGAIVVTGITPQMTLADGITEAEFFSIFIKEIATPGTVFVGFNSVRFDDEFIRYGLYRNFYDPYEWQWKDGRSRWDILDLSRMTRALRPDGITWPFAPDGKPTNRLEFLSSVNKLDHFNAHDALSDVNATIAVAELIESKQPKLFKYSFGLRTKKEVEKFIKINPMFVYVSGKYSSDHEKLAVVKSLGSLPEESGSYLVYNLLIDPKPFLSMSVQELTEAMTYKKDAPETSRLPVKVLKTNRCPSLSPLAALRKEDEARLNIDHEAMMANLEHLNSDPEFLGRIIKARKQLDSKYEKQALHVDPTTVDGKLYDGFFSDTDRFKLPKIHASEPDTFHATKFSDQRLNMLLPLYKARNFPKQLSAEERSQWENHKMSVYLRDLPPFMKKFEEASGRSGLSADNQYALEELKLYVESLIPAELYS
jgi:exodeoxyribonuclease-1